MNSRHSTASNDPTQVESHFSFGENWQSFLRTVSEDSIAAAVCSFERLLPESEIKDRRILDIGCGSGLSMLAASRLGARSVDGIDIDPASAAAAQTLLSQHLSQSSWSVRTMTVFDLTPDQGTYDIVHSWGVLHHTGDMWTALRKAGDLVVPGGLLVIALYRKTPICGFWKIEKKFYTSAGVLSQAIIRSVYAGIYVAGLIATGRNPVRYVREYRRSRGMNFMHNVHDWLGGYPYESADPHEVNAAMEQMGFRIVRRFEKPVAIGGLLGSHCDEFVAVRKG